MSIKAAVVLFEITGVGRYTVKFAEAPLNVTLAVLFPANTVPILVTALETAPSARITFADEKTVGAALMVTGKVTSAPTELVVEAVPDARILKPPPDELIFA